MPSTAQWQQRLHKPSMVLVQLHQHQRGCKKMTITEVIKPPSPQQQRVAQLKSQLDQARVAQKRAKLNQQQIKLNQQRAALIK